MTLLQYYLTEQVLLLYSVKSGISLSCGTYPQRPSTRAPGLRLGLLTFPPVGDADFQARASPPRAV